MKQNRSLAVSSKIQECKMGNIIGVLENEFPKAILDSKNEDIQKGSTVGRDRVFTSTNTLLTMVLTSVQQDKTLKNSVDLFYIIHQKHKSQAADELGQIVQAQQEEVSKSSIKKAGRPSVIII